MSLLRTVRRSRYCGWVGQDEYSSTVSVRLERTVQTGFIFEAICSGAVVICCVMRQIQSSEQREDWDISTVHNNALSSSASCALVGSSQIEVGLS